MCQSRPLPKRLHSSRKYGDLDSTLSTTEKAQRVAWSAHVETNIGDLVAHMFFSLSDNWWKLTNPAYASVLPVPQRYYVPGRIRETFKPRLEASGLWNLPSTEPKEKNLFAQKKEESKDQKHIYDKAFKREKLLAKARSALDIYIKLLGSKQFFFHEWPTTLDVLLAAHVLLVITPPFPDPLLKSLFLESYPSLVAHAKLILSHAFPVSGKRVISGKEVISQMPPISPPASYSLSSLLPFSARSLGEPKSKDPEDVRLHKLRRRWIGLAVASIFGYGALIIASASRLAGTTGELKPLQAQGDDEVDVVEQLASE